MSNTQSATLPTTPDARRAAACLAACEGLRTEQLEAMVAASEPGVLATAYDVCSSIWESHGIDLVGSDQVDGAEVDGAEASATLLDLGPQVEQVVFWARGAGTLS